MKIIQIVPQFPPAISGVGDYALNLARQMRQDFAMETHFVVGDSDWNGAKKIEGFAVSKISTQSGSALASLLAQLSIDKVLLHYVGYGYAQRGCPVWLIEGLEKWRNSKGNSRRLITMFHEIYASSWKPWVSSFWLSSLQKKLTISLTELSDSRITSLQEYSQIISNLSRKKPSQIITSPVFSNIGEPTQVCSLAKRERQLIVFGGRGRRTKVYQNSIKQLNLACQLLKVKEVIDIGPSTGLKLNDLVAVSLKEMGELNIKEISQILSTSLGGFFDYNIKRIAKSTIFASYCSHGVLPICSQNNHLVVDGIKAEKHYWVVGTKKEGLRGIQNLQEIADNAYKWYQNHRLSQQTQLFVNQLNIK